MSDALLDVRRRHHDIGRLIPLACCVLVAAHLAAVTAFHLAPQGDWHPTGLGPVDATGHFDGVWYTRIAEDGYGFSVLGASAWAFFPGYPLLIRALTAVSGFPFGLSAYLIAVVAGTTAVVLFRRWATVVRPADAGYATWALVLYPYAMFLFGPMYSDGIALCLTVAAFTAAEKDHFWRAGLLAGAATFCRPVALAVVVGLAWRVHERSGACSRRVRVARTLAAGALASIGQGAFMAMSWVSVRDPLAFLHAQDHPTWQGSGGPMSRLTKSGYRAIVTSMDPGNWSTTKVAMAQTMGLLMVVIFAVCITRLGHLLSTAYIGYSGLSLLPILVGSTTFTSSGRYLLGVFPVFLVLGMYAQRMPRGLAPVVTILLVVLQITLAVAFSRGLLVG